MANGKNTLEAAYLAVGDDKLKTEAVVARMNARMAELGDMAMDSDVFDGNTSTGAEIVAACQMFPVFAPSRLVTVKNTDKLGNDDSEHLVEYLQSPNASTVLLLIATKLASNTRLYKAVQKISASSVINCQTPKARNLTDTVLAYGRQNGATLDTAAAAKLIELVGTDTVALNNEVKKIVLASGKNRLTVNDVTANVAQTASAKPWDFTNAVLARNLNKALLVLETFEPGAEYRLLPATCNALKELICVQSLGSSASPNSIAQALGMPPAMSWKYKNHIRLAHNYTRAELRQALIDSLKCEARMKSTSDSLSSFKEYIISVISR